MNRNQLEKAASEWLAENHNIQSVVITRPVEPKRYYYENASQESYARMPATCDTVQEILAQLLPLDVQVRSQIFRRIHDEITTKFRRELDEVLQQKYVLMERLENFARDALETAHEYRMEKPDSERMRKKYEQRNTTRIEVDPAEETIASETADEEKRSGTRRIGRR
jgi:hypothetical protein